MIGNIPLFYWMFTMRVLIQMYNNCRIYKR